MAKFDIIEVSKKGFLKTWEDRFLLLKPFLLAVVVHALSFYYFAQGLHPVEDAGPEDLPFELVMGMPVYIGIALFVVGVFFFSNLYIRQARFILIPNEEVADQDGDAKYARKKAFILGTLVVVGYFAFRQILAEGSAIVSEMVAQISDFAVSIFAVVNLLILLWLIRFGVLHIPAAVGHSLKDFLYKVRGLKFSFYLLGVFFVVLVPASFVCMLISMIVISLFEWGGMELKMIVLSLMLSLSYVFAFLVLNGAAVFAVDEVMRSSENEEA